MAPDAMKSADARLAEYRAGVESLLRVVHKQTVSSIMEIEGAALEVQRRLAETLPQQDRFLRTWIETVCDENSQGLGSRTIRLLDDFRDGFTVRTAATAAKGLLDGLLGLSLMAVSATRELYYAGTYHPLVSREYRLAIMDEVFVPIPYGSVGYAFRSGERALLVPDSIRELRGRVSIEDLVGGNISILMRPLPAPPDSNPNDGEAYGVLFFFLPIAGFFEDGKVRQLQNRLIELADSHSVGLFNGLRWADTQEEKVRIDELLRSSAVVEATEFDENSDRDSETYMNLLRSILPARAEHDPLGGAVAIALRERHGNVEPLAILGAQRHLERHLLEKARENPRFDKLVRQDLGLSTAAGADADPDTAIPALATHAYLSRSSTADAGDSVLDLCYGELIGLLTPRGMAEHPGFLIAHAFVPGQRQGSTSVAKSIPQGAVQDLFEPLSVLERARLRGQHNLRNVAARICVAIGADPDPARAAMLRAEFESAVATLKLLTESQESYLSLLASALSRDLKGDEASRTEHYISALFGLLAARGAIEPFAVKGDGIIRAAETARSSLMKSGRELGGTLVGVTAFRVGRGHAFLVDCKRHHTDTVGKIPRSERLDQTPVAGRSGRRLTHEIETKLREVSEIARLARVVELLNSIVDAGREHGVSSVCVTLAPDKPIGLRTQPLLNLVNADSGEYDASALFQEMGYTGELSKIVNTSSWVGRAVLRLVKTTPSKIYTTVEIDTGETTSWDLEWACCSATMPLRLALDVDSLQHVVNDEAQASHPSGEVGLNANYAASKPETLIMDGATGFARTFRRLLDLRSPEDLAIVTAEAPDGWKEHYAIGFSSAEGRRSLDLLRALEKLRTSVLGEAFIAVQRNHAEIAKGAMHHLGNLASQIATFSKLLVDSQNRQSRPEAEQLHLARSLAAMIRGGATRLLHFRDAAFESLGGKYRPHSSAKQLPLVAALREVASYRYLEIAAYIELFRIHEDRYPGVTREFLDNLLASLTSAYPYVEGQGGGNAEASRVRQLSVALPISWPERADELPIEDCIAGLAKIGIQLEIHGGHHNIPQPFCDLAFDEVIHNALKEGLRAHWVCPNIPLRIEIHADSKSITVENPFLTSRRERLYSAARSPQSFSETAGLRAIELMLDPEDIKGPVFSEGQPYNEEVESVIVSFHWGPQWLRQRPTRSVSSS